MKLKTSANIEEQANMMMDPPGSVAYILFQMTTSVKVYPITNTGVILSISLGIILPIAAVSPMIKPNPHLPALISSFRPMWMKMGQLLKPVMIFSQNWQISICSCHERISARRLKMTGVNWWLLPKLENMPNPTAMALTAIKPKTLSTYKASTSTTTQLLTKIAQSKRTTISMTIKVCPKVASESIVLKCFLSRLFAFIVFQYKCQTTNIFQLDYSKQDNQLYSFHCICFYVCLSQHLLVPFE